MQHNRGGSDAKRAREHAKFLQRMQKIASGKGKPVGGRGSGSAPITVNHQQSNFSLRRLHEGWFPKLDEADVKKLGRFEKTGFGNYTYTPLRDKSPPGKLVFNVEFERKAPGQIVGILELHGIFEIDLIQMTIKRHGLNV